VRRPGAPWLFALWMAVSAAVAVASGLVLGILAALETGYGLDRWTQTVQAHGRLQLWGFAGVFIVTLAFEFLHRMNARPPYPAWLRVASPAALAFGALFQAAAQVWFEHFRVLGPLGGGLMVFGAVAFAVAAARTRPPHSLRLDPQPWFFWLGGAWLAAAAVLALAASLEWDGGVALPVESHALSEVFLRGFVLQVILAVAPRALAGHVGLPRLSARRQVTLLVAVNLTTLAWLAAQDVWVLPGIAWLARAADAMLAIAMLAVTWWLRIFSGLPARWRGERYEWAIPLAWVGAVVYAATMLIVRVSPAGDDLTLYQEGALRHIFLLGFMLPLMVAMAHIVLARFGAGFIPHENLLTAAFALLALAWPLRVLPALGTEAPGEAGQVLMALAGVLTMVALGLTAFVSARTAMLTWRSVLQILAAAPS